MPPSVNVPCLLHFLVSHLLQENLCGASSERAALSFRRALLPVGLALREAKALLKEPAVEGLHVAHGRHGHEHVPAMGAYLVLHIALLVA